MLSNPNAVVDTVYHSDWGRIVATLIRFFGDFDIAEEAAQDAFAAALDQWRTDGVPECFKFIVRCISLPIYLSCLCLG